MPIIDYPASEFSPRHLSKEEIANPKLAIDAFFDFAHLPQHRELLKQTLKAMVTGSFHTLPMKDKEDLMYYFGKIEKMVECTHLLYKGENG